ncbi:MAG TPA: SxtJ family membrane protein [Candidatus Binataceae bacterium]|nr:SxtJ family membrane protein [Candidatus Binataceae bacterium]
MDERVRAGLGERVETAELRKFGLIVGSAFGGLFGLLGPLLRHHPIPLWPWILFGLLVVPALVMPRALYYPQRAWTRLGHLLGMINSTIILNLLFYLIILPTGAIARLFGWDPMRRKFAPELQSYRINVEPAAPETMERPY